MVNSGFFLLFCLVLVIFSRAVVGSCHVLMQTYFESFLWEFSRVWKQGLHSHSSAPCLEMTLSICLTHVCGYRMSWVLAIAGNITFWQPLPVGQHQEGLLGFAKGEPIIFCSGSASHFHHQRPWLDNNDKFAVFFYKRVNPFYGFTSFQEQSNFHLVRNQSYFCIPSLSSLSALTAIKIPGHFGCGRLAFRAWEFSSLEAEADQTGM